MEDTRIRDLTFRVGATYVYTHQGDCEHALRVTDIRLATSAELAVAPGGAFPATTYKLPRQVRKCAICEMATAIKVVYNSRLAPESPCFFCQDCFQVRTASRIRSAVSWSMWKLTHLSLRLHSAFTTLQTTSFSSPTSKSTTCDP